MRGAVFAALPASDSTGSTEFIVAELAKVSFNSCFQQICLLFIGADDEDGVVSSDCADDLRPVFIVDSGSDWLGASGCCYQNKQIHCLSYFKTKTLKQLADSR